MNRRYWNELADDYINKIEKWLNTHCQISSANKFALIEAKLDWSKRPRRVYEYASFDSDPVIGGFYTNNLEHKLLHHLTHEMAHAAQYNHKNFHKMHRVKPHGNEFKMFYKELREVFLNPFLPDQELMESEFRKHKKMAYSIEIPNMIAASKV